MDCKLRDKSKVKNKSTSLDEDTKMLLENQVETLEDACENNESSKKGFKMGFAAGFSKGYSRKSSPRKVAPEVFQQQPPFNEFNFNEFNFHGMIVPIGANGSHRQALARFSWWATIDCNRNNFTVRGNSVGRATTNEHGHITARFQGECYDHTMCRRVFGEFTYDPAHGNLVNYSATITMFPYSAPGAPRRMPFTLWTGTSTLVVQTLAANIFPRENLAPVGAQAEPRLYEEYAFNNTDPPCTYQQVTAIWRPTGGDEPAPD